MDCGNLFPPLFFPARFCSSAHAEWSRTRSAGSWRMKRKRTFHHTVQSLYEKPALCAPTVAKLTLCIYTTSISYPPFIPPSTDRPANHAAVIRGADKKSIVLARRQAAPQMKKNVPVPENRASKMITLTDPSIMCSVPLPAEENIGCSVPAKCLGGGVGRRGGWGGATHPWLGRERT